MQNVRSSTSNINDCFRRSAGSFNGSVSPWKVGLIVMCLLAVVVVDGDITPILLTQMTCPASSPCRCELDDDNRTIVNCRYQGLRDVPKFNSTSMVIYELTLAGNNIQSIPSSSFAGLHITRLDLTGNDLEQFENDAFYGVNDVLEELLLQLGPSTPFPTTPLSVLTGLRLLHVESYRVAASLPTRALAALTNLHSLTLTASSLDRLTVDDVASQVSTLSYLDLSNNQLSRVPSQALKTLLNLTHVDLKLNKITVIDAATFTSLARVRYIDLSYNAISQIDENAFQPLALSLLNLSMSYCHLTDSLLKTVGQLTRLRKLNIESNQITNIDKLFDGMNSLQELNAKLNNIGSLSKITLKSLSSSLRYLHLESNPSMTVSDDAFSHLSVLEELYLDGASSVQLSADTFQAQRSSLRTLSLRNTHIGQDQVVPANGSEFLPWLAFHDLTALETLYLSRCSLAGAVPDFALVLSTSLHKIDLSDNAIEIVSQRSLAGLQNILTDISLVNNKIQTLDQCVFFRFTDINIFKVDLSSNPLVCDCRMKWLYNKLQTYRNDSRYGTLAWTCASTNNVPGSRLFTNLTDTDFANCAPSTTVELPCEDLTPSTPLSLPGTTSTDRPRAVSFRVNQTTSTNYNLYVWWSISPTVEITSLAVTCRQHDSSTADRLEVTSITYDGWFVVPSLTPGTIYEACLEVETKGQGTITECATGATTGKPSSASLSLILGVAIGGILALLVVVVIIVWCCIAASKRRKRDEKAMQQLTEATASKRTVQTKRFRKQNTSMTGADLNSGGGPGGGHYGAGAGPTVTITDADFDRALVTSVERLDPQSKDLLASLLRTASAASLDRLTSGATLSTNFYVPRSYNDDDRDYTDQHVYEVLPNDDTYDTIPTDDTV